MPPKVDCSDFRGHSFFVIGTYFYSWSRFICIVEKTISSLWSPYCYLATDYLIFIIFRNDHHRFICFQPLKRLPEARIINIAIRLCIIFIINTTRQLPKQVKIHKMTELS